MYGIPHLLRRETPVFVPGFLRYQNVNDKKSVKFSFCEKEI